MNWKSEGKPTWALEGEASSGAGWGTRWRGRGESGAQGLAESLRRPFRKVYRRLVAAGTVTRRVVFVGGLLASLLGCTSVDPGPDFVVPNITFDPDYFYCHVEPQFIFGANYKCGTGDTTKGDPGNGCHFNPSAVTGMQLQDHPPVNCNGGDHPVDLSQLGNGLPPAANLQAVSLEMNADYTAAPVFVRPTGNTHPRAVFSTSDSTANTTMKIEIAKIPSSSASCGMPATASRDPTIHHRW